VGRQEDKMGKGGEDCVTEHLDLEGDGRTNHLHLLSTFTSLSRQQVLSARVKTGEAGVMEEGTPASGAGRKMDLNMK